MTSRAFMKPELRAGSTWRFAALCVTAALGAALAILVAVTLVRFLTGVGADLHSVSQRMDALPEMNRKLDRLEGVASSLGSVRAELHGAVALLTATNRTLDATNLKLDATNGKLDATNRSIGAMAHSLERMQSQLAKLDGMRTDIHTMTHKVSGSFLFRAVK
jgi:hypothetical protein